jgi:hypothetical protein
MYNFMQWSTFLDGDGIARHQVFDLSAVQTHISIRGIAWTKQRVKPARPPAFCTNFGTTEKVSFG